MSGRGRFIGPLLCLGPIGVFVSVFALLPLALVIGSALGVSEGDLFGPLRRVLVLPSLRGALWGTVSIASGVMMVAVLLGVPLAFVLARLEVWGEERAKSLLVLPAVVPPYLFGIAWIDLANPRTGILNLVLRDLGYAGPPLDCYTPAGIIFVLGLSSFPLVLLPVLAALERLDASLEETARISGASPLRVFWDVTLPLVRPAIQSGALLVFLSSASAFGVPYLLGTSSTDRTPVLTTEIVSQMTLGGERRVAEAMALAVLLCAVSGLVAVASSLLERNKGRLTVIAGKAQPARRMRILGRSRWLLHAVLYTFIFVAVVLPILTLFWLSIIHTFGAGFGPQNLSLHNYQKVIFENRDTVPALLRSVFLAFLAALFALVAGTVVSLFGQRRPSLLVSLLAHAANLPYAVPGTVLALGILASWSQEVRIILFERVTLIVDLFAGVGALFVAYAVKYLSLGLRSSRAALSQIDPSLVEAARVSGANEGRAVLDVVLPLIRASLLAAFVLVFLPVLSEITMSVLLVGPGTQVVGTVLFELQSYADPPSAAVVACLLVSLTLGGHFVASRTSGRRGGSVG